MLTTHYNICAPQRLRIALVADLHERDPQELILRLREAKPDIICIAGDTLECFGGYSNLTRSSKDFMTHLVCTCTRVVDTVFSFLSGNTDAEICHENGLEFLRQASRLAPVCMSLGNHEAKISPEFIDYINSLGIHLLNNSAIELNGILFGGLPSKQVCPELDTAFLQSFSQSRKYKILLCHHPEYCRYLENYDFDLMLCGHCHGGQIRIFGHGIFAPGQGLFPKYHHGRYGRMIVSSGCANNVSIPRWGNEPELVVLELSPDTDLLH